MYLIVKEKCGYRAVPIRAGDKCKLSKVLPGNQEVRIALRINGRRYLLYSTRALTKKYPALGREQLIPMCDEIITQVSACIRTRLEYIDMERISGAAECRHHRRWCDLGLISPASPTEYHGHPIDSKTEQLVSYVRVDHGDIIVMDHEPPVDCEQEELPY